MPSPSNTPFPDLEAFTDINFIVNYFLQGCEAPFWLFVEFAAPAADDTLHLILVPQIEDIVQAVLDPSGHKSKRPARKGRKRNPLVGLTNVDDLIGGKIRGAINPINGLNVSPFKWLFRGINIVEGVNFANAIVQNLTDVGFEGIWGIINLNPRGCSKLAYIFRDCPTGIEVIGAAAPHFPLNVCRLVNVKDFFSPSGNAASTQKGEWEFFGKGTVEALTLQGIQGLVIEVYSLERGVLASKPIADLPQGGKQDFVISADCLPGETVSLARSIEFGNIRVTNACLLYTSPSPRD